MNKKRIFSTNRHAPNSYQLSVIYEIEFPNVIRYGQKFNLSVEVVLERSAEMIEIIRRGMASLHPAGRWMGAYKTQKSK